jgi:endonuclease/exonuclease/phosphatase family metal-dependent hydrolase
MRIATFNVENLFERAKALNGATWAEGRQALEDHARINRLLNKASYSAADRKRIVELLTALGLDKSDDGHSFARLRQNRGKLLKRPRTGPPEVVADGRDAWIGWVELKTEPVSELATRHTAMVIQQVDADVLGVVEAEDRVALKRFSELLLTSLGALPYAHVMVIDGNDDRGIDVGLMTKAGFDIAGIRSHVDDDDGQGQVFSRDCPEFVITTPSGERLVVLVNHFKSKGFGAASESNRRRERQAKRVKEIYERLRADGERHVVVMGDFNDTPGSRPLAPLLENTDLEDISAHPNFVSDGRPGTFRNGTKSNKIDYVLLSPELFANVTHGTFFRDGVWGGVHGTLFPHFPTMTRAIDAASDHAAVVADVDL